MFLKTKTVFLKICFLNKQKNIPKNVIQIIQDEFKKTGKKYDWKVALCINEYNLSMTYRFSESMRQEWERKRNGKGQGKLTEGGKGKERKRQRKGKRKGGGEEQTIGVY